MPLVGITNRGLTTLAILVALLWGCLVAERVTAVRANREASQVIEQLRRLRMKRFVEPAPQIPARPWMRPHPLVTAWSRPVSSQPKSAYER